MHAVRVSRLAGLAGLAADGGSDGRPLTTAGGPQAQQRHRQQRPSDSATAILTVTSRRPAGAWPRGSRRNAHRDLELDYRVIAVAVAAVTRQDNEDDEDDADLRRL